LQRPSAGEAALVGRPFPIFWTQAQKLGNIRGGMWWLCFERDGKFLGVATGLRELADVPVLFSRTT